MCDVKGCWRIPYAEVYKPTKTVKKNGKLEYIMGTWNYLCKKHYKEEYAKHGDEYGWLELDIPDRIRAIYHTIVFRLRENDNYVR